MRKWLPRVLLVGVGILYAGGPYAAAQAPDRGGERPPAPREQPPRLAPDQEAAGILQQAYDSLSLVHVWMSSNRAKLPESDARLADQADDFYRSAHSAYKDRNFGRATFLALAAADASRGLISALHAHTQPPSNLPAPPEPPAPAAAPPGRQDFPPQPRDNASGERGAPPQGERAPAPSPAGGAAAPRTPKEMAREVLRAAYRGLGDAEKAGPGKGPAAAFLDASRGAYEQGRKDYDAGNYVKALDLAAAAEAWSHVGEDLKRADSPNRPAPGRRETTAPPE
jgi:hypothetical protein